MMTIKQPQIIELTREEGELYSRIPKEVDLGLDWQPIADAMEDLAVSLEERGAIPEVRLRAFNDPRYAETGQRSVMETFEGNGTCGADILRHGHFVEWIHYFVQGPNLPPQLVATFCERLSTFIGTSGMELSERHRLTREAVRKYQLERHSAATEFFRLGLEIGLSPEESRGLRQAALSVRK